MTRRSPSYTLFPYTTLFRSMLEEVPDRVKSAHRHQPGNVEVLGFVEQVSWLYEEKEHRACAKRGEKDFRMAQRFGVGAHGIDAEDRKSTRLNSSHVKISYAV